MNFPKKIFLADDDCDDVDFFAMAISEIAPESEFIAAGDGQELIDKLRSTGNTPDIIFLDINMPKMDGIAALRAIRNEAPVKDIPVIMYSTSNNELFVKQAYEAGANCFFTKPFDFNELKACISNFLKADWRNTRLPYDEFAVVV